MKRIALALATFVSTAFIAQAQFSFGEVGKSFYYYDKEETKVKEIFHYMEVIKMKPDPNNKGSYIDTSIQIKSGPYTKYFESGELMVSGYYDQGVQDSTWLYYNKTGAMIRKEFYRKGELVKNP